MDLIYPQSSPTGCYRLTIASHPQNRDTYDHQLQQVLPRPAFKKNTRIISYLSRKIY